MQDSCDVAIIGAGILGCTAAYQLSQYRGDILVLERFDDVGCGSSKANSGLIHAGFHPRAGSLKGTSCTRGNELYGQMCADLGVSFKRIGSLYVSFGPNGEERMYKKYQNGLANGVPDMRIVTGDEARAIEPRLSDKAISALWAPTTAIVSPFELVLGLYEASAANGVEYRFSSPVERVERDEGNGSHPWTLHLAGGDTVHARYVVNTAGDDAEPLDAQVHKADLVIRPRRGQFYVFDKQDPDNAITHVLYQSQETNEKGTLLAPTVDGNIVAGPTSENVRDYTHTETTVEGLEHIEQVARKLIPDIDLGRVINAFAGVRANVTNVEKERKDFVVRVSAPGFVSALGIKNPGMTSAPALVERMVELLAREGMPQDANPAYRARHQRYVPFMKSDARRQAELLARDPSYAHVICRCERITEGDVRHIAAMDTCPHTFDAVKKRLRVSMGRCQGSFCTPRVAQVLADVWDTEPCRIPFNDAGGTLSFGKVK
jgi:glycerol-3-phosphate dehydrogenase